MARRAMMNRSPAANLRKKRRAERSNENGPNRNLGLGRNRESAAEIETIVDGTETQIGENDDRAGTEIENETVIEVTETEIETGIVANVTEMTGATVDEMIEEMIGAIDTTETMIDGDIEYDYL